MFKQSPSMDPQMGPLAFLVLLSKLLSRRFSLGDVIKIMIAMISYFSNLWTQTPYAHSFWYHVHWFWSHVHSNDRHAPSGVTLVTCMVLSKVATGGRMANHWWGQVLLLLEFPCLRKFFLLPASSQKLYPPYLFATVSHIIMEPELLCLNWM